MTLKDRIRWYWKYWVPHRQFLVFLFLFTLVSSAVTVAYPLVFREVIDRMGRAFAAPAPVAIDMRSLLGLLGLIAAGRFVAGFYPCFRAWMNQRLEKDIREAYFSKILDKDHRFFNKFRTGDLVTRLTDDISEHPKVAWFGCSGIFRAVESSSKLVFCIGVMLALNWRLALLALVPIPAMLYVFYKMRSRMTRVFHEQQTTISKTNDLLEATFSGIRIVKAFQAEKGQKARLARILDDRIGVQLRAAKMQVFFQLYDTLASRVGQAVVIAAGGYMVVRGNFTLGGLYAFYVYLDMLIHPMIDLPNMLVTGKQAFVCVDRLEEVGNFPSSERASADGAIVSRIGTLELQGVAASYDGTRGVLAGASLALQAGSRVAVVGAVGSGKTTLLKILVGLLEPTEGEVRVNGTALRDVDMKSYRARLGYVPQEALLFSETILDNVSFGRGLDADQVKRALAVAQMEREVDEMPEKLEAVPGNKGLLVSGGQRQRLAIARAVAAEPDVLLLDDCTASLDARLEDRFWSALFTAMPNVTCLVVSHRPATILRCDRVVMLGAGRMLAQGTHAELLETCHEYRDFMTAAEKRAKVEPAEESAEQAS